MDASALHPSKSTQDLIQTSRPGFPMGLRVLYVMKDTALHAPAKKLLEDIGYKVTTTTTLDKGLGILESAATDPSAAFDVALVEGKQAEPLFHAPSSPATATSTATATASPPDAALSARFTRLAKDVAIVLMHEEEDVSSKAYMIEAIKVGVVDVVRFPLVKQSMRTLWQHAVRKMIRAQGTAEGAGAKRSGAGSGGAAKRGNSRAGGLRLDQDNSGDSSASEERALKRPTAGSPASVLDDEEKAGVAESGGGGSKRVAAGAKGGGAKVSGKESGAAEGSGKKANGAAKPKPQARSTQQWKAAEQRGRRLAIKPHTAMTQGGQGNGSGPQMGRMGYYHPQQGQMMGQTQTMTINGQQVQVWVPMQHGMYAHPQQQQQNNQGLQGGAPQNQNTSQPSTNGANGAQPPTNGPNGASQGGGKSGVAGGQTGAQQQQSQPQHGYYGGGGMMQMPGGYHQPPPGMMLVQQPNGQQMWVQQAPVHGGWGQQQWGEAAGGDDGHAEGGGGGYPNGGGYPGGDFNAADAIKGHPLPLGLNLKRSNSLQNMVETSGLLDAKFDNPMDANVFRDDDFMEEDALDAILAQSRDGNLLSFDGMDEAMLEAAAGGGNGLEGMVRG